ncbi:MAG: glycosyltransferase [Verrucomicrobiota bacterium]
MPTSLLRACQVVASINRDTGGPAVSVTRLATELSNQVVESYLAALDYQRLGPMEPTPGVIALTYPASCLARNFRGWSPTLRRELAGLAAGRLNVIHNHGVWMFPNTYARQAAISAGIPLVISTRGMLDAWSLRRSQWKKRVVWAAMERANLAAARVFHVTSEAEGSSLRALGLRQPIAMIPNGVDLPDPVAGSAREALHHRFPSLTGRRLLLFMSRLHPKKGLKELLLAWHELAHVFPEWQLVVAGPDLDGYGGRMEAEAVAMGIGKRVTFTGMLEGSDKAGILGGAEVFILPTHSENFGIVIAEALAHGVPVITTKAAPWGEVVSHRCGWWIEGGAGPLETTLRDSLAMDRESLRDMGARGRRLVVEKYSWSSAAEQMSAVYRWCLGDSEYPACLHVS